MDPEKRKRLSLAIESPHSELLEPLSVEHVELVLPSQPEVFEIEANSALAVSDNDWEEAQRAAVLCQNCIPDFSGIIERGLKKHEYEVVTEAEGFHPLRDVDPNFTGVETYENNVVMWEVVAARMNRKTEIASPLALPEGDTTAIVPIETALTKPGKHNVWDLVPASGPTHRLQTLRVVKKSTLPMLAEPIPFPQRKKLLDEAA